MDFRGKTILLVEDEAVIALQEKLWLQREGYKVIHVSTGEDAIKTVNKDPESVDLILMDINLGSAMDGTDAAFKILESHDIPLLFLSSHTEKSIVNLTEEITSYGYVVKGSGETVLIASIKMAFKLFESKKETLAKEANLYNTAESLSITLQSIGDGVIATDINGNVTLMNPMAQKLCGWKIEDAKGRPLTEVFKIINAKTRKTVANPVNEVLKTGEKVGLANHTVLISRDGNEYQIFDSAAPIRDKNGNVLGVVLVFSDVTEKYKKEEELRISEEKFRTLVENAPAAITIARKGYTIYSNSVLANMLGLESVDEVLGKHLSDYLAPESKEKAKEIVNRREVGQDVPRSYEITAVRKNGEKFPVFIQTSRVMMPEGMTTIAVFTDMTEHYEMNNALRSSEERLRFVLEGGNIGFWDWDLVTDEVSRNDQWASMLGYGNEDLRPTIEQWQDLVHMDDLENIWQSIYDHLNGHTKVYNAEYRLRTKDGDYRWIQDRGTTTVRNEDGKPVRMSGIMLDITARKLNEIRLKHYTEELKTSNSVKDKYFSVLSHDLRGPFSGMLGLTKELATNIDQLEKEEITEIAAVMHQSAKETNKLLLNLLEWSRIQTGKFEISPVELNLFLEAEDIRLLFSSAAAHKNISIINDVDKELFVHIDKNALQTILRNLIDNAIKFTDEGGNVTISSVKSDGFVELSVADSGIGMDQESLEKIFRIGRFSTSGTKGEKGSGLGLSLCRDLVRKCGGQIRVKSFENKGTEFTFTLPQSE